MRLVEFAPFPRVASDQRWRSGFTLDLSSAGACLRVAEAVPAGSLLHVILRSVDGRPSLDAVARVAWSAPDPSGRGARVGLDLVAVRDRAPARARRSPALRVAHA